MITSQVEDFEGERVCVRIWLRHVEQVAAAFGHEAGTDLRAGEALIKMWKLSYSQHDLICKCHDDLNGPSTRYYLPPTNFT